MFNKHVTLALAAISTQALKLRIKEDYPIMGADGAGLAPQEELSVEIEELAQQEQEKFDAWACFLWPSPECFGLAQTEIEELAQTEIEELAQTA